MRRNGTSGRRWSVRGYLAAGFGACVAGLVAVAVLTTLRGFDAERERAVERLRGYALGAADWWDGAEADNEILSDIAADPGIAALDPSACGAFEPLRSVTEEGTHLHSVTATGDVVCSLEAQQTKGRFVPGEEVTAAIASGEFEFSEPAVDPVHGGPAYRLTFPISGPNGPGALVTVVPTNNPPMVMPRNAPKETSLIVTDAARSLVLDAVGEAPARAGQSLSGTVLAKRLRAGATIVDIDGRSRMYVEVAVPTYGFHAYAGLPESVAMREAYDQARQTAAVSGGAILLVIGLAFLLNRRLAAPVRELERSIRLASVDPDAPGATPSGPAEIAEVAGAFNDLLAERRSLEDHLRHRARHDPLTGLPNRLHLSELLDELLRDAGSAAVLFLDLDRFKLINDSHGHAIGDRVLVALGQRLEESTDGVVSRFGGDEFVIVQRDIDEAGAVEQARRIAQVLTSPLRVGGQELFVNGSIGITVGQAGDRAEDLLRNADTAMYKAKERGRGQWALFDEPMRAWSIAQLRVEGDLHRALKNGEFELHYQPKVAVANRRVVGVEALLRWHHPDRGMVSPAEFIPVAEESGLIVDVGEWVLAEAARQAATWRQRGIALPISVNLGARHLAQPDLPMTVADITLGHGALPSDVILEITESAVLEDPDAVAERLAGLRTIGFKIAIDDFGTGYSSLSYLQRLPIDELKVDRSFISSVGRDVTTEAIVGSIVSLAHAIGLSVVAEGVEEQEQLNTVSRLGCDLAQGYLLARPAPASALTGLVATSAVL